MWLQERRAGTAKSDCWEPLLTGPRAKLTFHKANVLARHSLGAYGSKYLHGFLHDYRFRYKSRYMALGELHYERCVGTALKRTARI